MLRAITQPTKVRAATKAFRDQLRNAAARRVRHIVGFPGGSEEADVWVFPRQRFFWAMLADGDPENRCWNGFGHVLPHERNVLPLDVEINVPWEGVNRTISGVFLDGDGEIYVGHRGRIGGGRKGVGKQAFWDRYSDQAQPVLDDDPVVVLGRVGSPRLIADLATFVGNVADIKREATSGQQAAGARLRLAHDEEEYSPEFEGVRTMTPRQTIEAQCRHGTIVRCLRDALVELEWSAWNDRGRDLVARRSAGAPTVTFEVKTDTSSQSIFTGIGQLVVHARPRATRNAAVLVIPDALPPGMEQLLAAEDIRVLRFTWEDDDRAVFPGLARVVGAAAARRA